MGLTTSRCCVIGGGGFIGNYLTEVLRDSGRHVIAVGRRSVVDNLPDGIEYRVCDYANLPALREILQECDEVVDLAYATVPQSSYLDPMYDLQANLPPV